MASSSVPHPVPSPPSREEQRQQDVAAARLFLRGRKMPPADVHGLAKRLQAVNEFAYARRLYGRLRRKGDYAGVKEAPLRIGQRHALCTYKDVDQQARDRYGRALEILAEVARLESAPAEKAESLGLKGAIYKRKWQTEGQAADLRRALAYYLEGHALGPEHDQGWNGINAAFVLDLVALEDAEQAAGSAAPWMITDDSWLRAHDIRQELTQVLPTLPGRAELAWLTTQWWYYATRAEAHFGLGEYGQAIAALREYNEAKGLDSSRPPVGDVPPWEFESTITQLAALARLQGRLARRLGDREKWTKRWKLTAEEMRAAADKALRDYLGELAPGVDRGFKGKLGLALSGGGFRASLFHIGVLAHLAERDVLRDVEVLSCVSGGSIVGAHYYLEVQRLLSKTPNAEIERKHYIELVRKLEKDFLDGVQTNIRCQVFGSIWSNLRVLFQPGYTTTRRLGELYESVLYSKVDDGCGKKPRLLGDLRVAIPGEGDDFKPKYDNWRLKAKVPVLVLNATTLNTGHNWQFTSSWMGEPPSSVDLEIDGNYRLRRMYHSEAPRQRDRWQAPWLRPFAPFDYQRMRLGHAVAASSCVPGLFEPITMLELYDNKVVRLVDGGVYDNQGIASLLEQDCAVMIVSDASGQMEAEDRPSGGRIGVPLRSSSVSMSRVRQAQYRELDARRRSGLLKGLLFLHLKKDLESDPVDWRECQDPFDASDVARPATRRDVLVGAGLQKSVQQLLSGIRTDLDSFTEVEAFALMTSGYRQAEAYLAECLPEFAGPTAEREDWRFLAIEPALQPGRGFDLLTRQLKVGKQIAGKVWRLNTPLMVMGGLAALAALAATVWWGWRHRNDTLLTVGSLGGFVGVAALAYVAPRALQLARFKNTLRSSTLRGAAGAALAVLFKIHRQVFDPLFLRQGKVKRLLAMRR